MELLMKNTLSTGAESHSPDRYGSCPAFRWLWAALVLACTSLASSAAAPPQVSTVVRADYQNELKNSPTPGVNPPSTVHNAMVFFSGHLSAQPAVVPNDGQGRFLVESAFGQTFASDIPFPGFVTTNILLAQSLLYPPANATRAQIESSTVIFRYKQLLYDNDGPDKIRANFENMAGWYGDNERNRFAAAIQPLRDALKYAPQDCTLREVFLDAYYDRAMAEVQFVKNNLVALSKVRLGLVAVNANEFVIDREIQQYTNIVAAYQKSLREYSQMLGDHMGVDVRDLDPGATPGTPFGLYLFQSSQPVRNQYAAQFTDANGVLTSVLPDGGDIVPGCAASGKILFNGFKDYVTLMGLLRDYTQHSAELARLYGMRGRRDVNGDDIKSAYDLLAQVEQEVGVSARLLTGMFSNYNFPPADASGARAAASGVELGLSELAGVRQFLDGQSNPLGFNPDFLVLIQASPSAPSGGPNTPSDSYDSLVDWIGGRSSPGPLTPLELARTAYEQAKTSYTSYRGHADELAAQLEDIDDTFASRYENITGFAPDETPGFDGTNPKPHSELAEVANNLATLKTQLGLHAKLDKTLSDNLVTANTAVDDAQAKDGAIEKAYNKYVNRNKEAWEEIQSWAGAAAGAQVAADTAYAGSGVDGVSTAFSGGVTLTVAIAAGQANGAIQASAAVKTAQRQQELDNSAARYDADLAKTDVALLTQQARQAAEGLGREQISNTIETGDLLGQFRQETANQARLMRELERIRQNRDSNLQSQSDRYYADPIHFLVSQNDMILADQEFQRALRWVFFTLRALEYKWNKDFIVSLSGRDYDRGTLFKLRNYREMKDYVAALEEFNRINLLGFSRLANTDRISLRDHVLAPNPKGGPDDGMRVDLDAPGGQELVTKTVLFQRMLARSLRDGFYHVNLNTVALDLGDNSTFFARTHYQANGTPINPGRYLDKIEWYKINLVCTNCGITDPQVYATGVSYGGSSAIRTPRAPCLDPNRPTTLPNDYKSFPFINFQTPDNGNTWESLPFLRESATIVLSSSAREPADSPGETLYRNALFKERSVATTSLEISIPQGLVQLNKLDDIIIYVRHLSATRQSGNCP